MSRLHLAWIALVAPLALLGGCASPVTVPVWQQSVERYVREEGKGDPIALRDVGWKDTSHGFQIFSVAEPQRSTDANGLLLAHRVIDERPWFVFLVGIVDKQKVEQIHLAALNVAGESYNWRLSAEDKDATRTYRAYNRDLFHERFPGRRSAPPEYTGFPRQADVFDVDVSGDTIIVTHPPSGATWTVNLTPAAS